MDEMLLGSSAAHGFKDLDYTLCKAPGVFRAFVLGDSLAFGQGVRIDETFSKVLEATLNRGNRNRVFDVINGAIPGLNTVQEYCLQKTLGTHYQPDLYLLTLCYNDTELFQPTDRAQDEEHLRRIWDTEGDTWPYFEEALTRIKREADSQGAKLAVAYLVFHYASVAVQAPQLLRELCCGLEVPFTDVGETTRQHPPESLWVNEVETHPNAMAHQMTAQHLAKFLSEEGLIPAEDPAADERALVSGVLGASLNSRGFLPPESLTNALARTHSLLQAKLQRPPARTGGDSRLAKEDLRNAISCLSPLLRRCQFVECLDGYDTYLRTVCIQDHVPLFKMKQMLSDLAFSVYYLSMASRLRSLLPEMVAEAEDDPPPPETEPLRKAVDYVTQAAGRIRTLQADLRRLYGEPSDPADRREAPECFLSPELARAEEQLRHRVAVCDRPSGLFIAEAHRVGLALRDTGNELLQELEASQELAAGDFPDADQFRRFRHLVWDTAHFYIEVAEQYYSSLQDLNIDGLARLARELAEGRAAHAVGRRVDFEITMNVPPSDEFCFLGMHWTSVVPLAAPRRDLVAVQNDGNDHTVRFRFFVGVLGYFALELDHCDPDHVRSIRMKLNGEPTQEWRDDAIQRMKASGMRSELLMLNETE